MYMFIARTCLFSFLSSNLSRLAICLQSHICFLSVSLSDVKCTLERISLFHTHYQSIFQSAISAIGLEVLEFPVEPLRQAFRNNPFRSLDRLHKSCPMACPVRRPKPQLLIPSIYSPSAIFNVYSQMPTSCAQASQSWRDPKMALLYVTNR